MRILKDVIYNLVLIILVLLLMATVTSLADKKATQIKAQVPLDLGKLPPEEKTKYDRYISEVLSSRENARSTGLTNQIKAYFKYVVHKFEGNSRKTTLKEIGLSFTVMTLTTLLIFLLGIYWGLKAGYKGGLSDRLLSLLAPVFAGIPSWFWALLFVWTLWWKYNIGDISYTNVLLRTQSSGWSSFLAHLNAITLPVLALTLSNVVVYAFNVRNLVKRESFEEYFLIDRLKGFSDRTIMRKLLRTVLPSFLTFTSYNFLNLLINGMAVEKLFEIPGIGGVLADSVRVVYLPNEFGEPKIPLLHFNGFDIFFVAFVMAIFYFLNSTILEALYLHLDPRREVNEQ